MTNLETNQRNQKNQVNQRFRHLIAESRTEEKDMMAKVVVNLINGNN